jgi:hypothetical protein
MWYALRVSRILNDHQVMRIKIYVGFAQVKKNGKPA